MSSWDTVRKNPYTDIGVRRLECIRCTKPACCEWSICADGNNHRPLCVECDIKLNALVLVWIDHPNPIKLLESYILSKASELGNNHPWLVYIESFSEQLVRDIQSHELEFPLSVAFKK